MYIYIYIYMYIYTHAYLCTHLHTPLPLYPTPYPVRSSRKTLYPDKNRKRVVGRLRSTHQDHNTHVQHPSKPAQRQCSIRAGTSSVRVICLFTPAGPDIGGRYWAGHNICPHTGLGWAASRRWTSVLGWAGETIPSPRREESGKRSQARRAFGEADPTEEEQGGIC